MRLYEDYYDGRHRLTFATSKFREAFGPMFAALADNWCPIVVDAPVERLAVDGFRFGPDQDADREAAEIWQANNLDAGSATAHTEAVKSGRSFVLVAPNPADRAVPRITVEHASQMVVATAAGDRRVRHAALKRWVDEDGWAMATLYLPDSIHKWRSKEKLRNAAPGGRISWVRRDDEAGAANPLGAVPVVPLENNPSLLGGGRSELVTAIPLQDAINKEVADLLIASEFIAFPQRVAMGVEVPKDPTTGLPLPAVELKAAMSRLWAFENENARIGEFSAANLDNYVKSTEMLIRHLAAQTRTPPHYLLGEIVNASGDALKAAETGLVAKVRRKQIDFGESWEETMRLAFSARGSAARADSAAAETIWRDPEYRSEGEQVDAAVKLRTLGVPLEMIWERVGFSQEQIARMKNMAGLPDRPPPGATTAAVNGGPPSAEPVSAT